MGRNTHITVFLALLVALVLSPALSGCSAVQTAKQVADAAKELATQVPQSQAQSSPTAPAATATPTATAVPAPTQAPAALAPTQTPTVASPTVTAAEVITKDVVIRSMGGEGEMTYQSAFTMTEQIQVGNVDGIDYTSTSAPMPDGAAPYDGVHLPQIGDVVQHPSGLVVQVTGVKTVDVDADNELVLVDLVVGNTSGERQLVATNPCMEIVSGDGHWYSAFWYSLYWAGLGASANDDAYATQMVEELQQSLLQHGISSDYSVALDPGQAAQGTAVFPVPKSAKQLAFGFQTYEAAMYLMFANEESPTIFVPLGLRGDFPAIPADVAPLDARATYQVGQSRQAPERGISLQVQSAWARLESLGNVWELGADEQFVVVNLIAPTSGNASPLDPARELALVDDSGNRFELQAYATDWLTFGLGPYNQRGVVVFKGLRDATGLKLEFTPLDPATMDGDSPEPLRDEAATIDLGPLAAASVAGTRANTSGPAAEATATPEPAAQAPGAGHPLGQQVVVEDAIGDLAITVTRAETTYGPEGHEASAGRTWVLAYVTLENVGSEELLVYPDRFAFVDQTGVVNDNLVNRPSAWDPVSSSILDFTHLAPGGVVENAILLVRVEETAVPGLMLSYRKVDDSRVLFALGL